MSESTFRIDIENSSGTRYGSGPITSAAQWTYTARMDKAGEFSFRMPATDAQASIVQRKRIARAWALVGDVWTEVGAGIIDNIERRPQADGTVVLEVSGADLLRELTYRSVKNLKLYSGGLPVSHAASVGAVSPYAPSGWTLTPDAAPPNDLVYGRYNGESVLAAIIKIADKSQVHFYRGSGRSVVFAHEFSDSGIRAIQAGPGDLAAETCAITALTETVDTYDMLTRIYPRGSGNGDVQLTLRATTRSAPAGYTLDAANNYIENDAATAEFGRIEEFVEWREIGPVANTIPDIQAASDMLFDEALRELQRRSEEIETPYYALSLAGCSALLRPMQTVRVVWRDADAGVDVDRDLNIIETTWRVDASGVQTTALTVTTSDRWPQSDAGAIVESMRQGIVYQAHPQLNANSYTTGYTKNIDSDYNAVFRFRLGAEVVQVQQVLMEFQLLPFESTVKSVGGESVTSEASGEHSHTVTIPDHTHTVTIGNHTHTVSIPDHTHTVTIPDHSHTVTIPDHSHDIEVYDTPSPGSPSMKGMFLDISNDIFAVAVSGTGDVEYLPTTSEGGGSTPTTSNGGGSTPTTSNGGGSTPTTSDGGATTPTTSNGGGSTPTSSSGGEHTHTVTPDISPVYGVFREAANRTYPIAHLQYRVNSGAWASLAADAEDAGGDWWRLDVTDAIIDADTFRPTQEANTIEMRAFGITASVVGAGFVAIQELGSGIGNLCEAGDTLEISGTTHYDGTHIVDFVFDEDTIVTTTSTGEITPEDGTILFHLTVTIDALLSVRNVIQAIAYV